MKLFVKIKHWQFFLVIVLLQYFVKVGITGVQIGAIYWIIFSAWLYSISVIGQKKLSSTNLHQNADYLKICCFLMPILMLIVILSPTASATWSRIGRTFIGLVWFFCWFYSAYFTAKTVKTLKKQSIPKFKEYVLLILGFIVWPIGMWFIQPKVNKICA